MSSTTPRATRRVALAGVGVLAAGTVAAAMLWRKPAAPLIHTPVEPEPVALQPDSALQPVTPPSPPAAAGFTDAAGMPHTLADFAGKGLLVNCWATWCTPCVAEMPALQTLAKALAPDGILVLPLSSDRGGADVVRTFYAAHGITDLPVWLDPKGAVADAWGARGLPTTFVIDRQGREQGRFEGAIDWAAPATQAKIRALVGA